MFIYRMFIFCVFIAFLYFIEIIIMIIELKKNKLLSIQVSASIPALLDADTDSKNDLTIRRCGYPEQLLIVHIIYYIYFHFKFIHPYQLLVKIRTYKVIESYYNIME